MKLFCEKLRFQFFSINLLNYHRDSVLYSTCSRKIFCPDGHLSHICLSLLLIQNQLSWQRSAWVLWNLGGHLNRSPILSFNWRFSEVLTNLGDHNFTQKRILIVQTFWFNSLWGTLGWQKTPLVSYFRFLFVPEYLLQKYAVAFLWSGFEATTFYLDYF